MKKESARDLGLAGEAVVQDISQALPGDAVHHGALGSKDDYQSLARIKALVDFAFDEVAKGKLSPGSAIRCVKGDVWDILANY